MRVRCQSDNRLHVDMKAGMSFISAVHVKINGNATECGFSGKVCGNGGRGTRMRPRAAGRSGSRSGGRGGGWRASAAGEDWRPHTVSGKDVQDKAPEEIPVELADGYVEDEGGQVRFDLDADESRMLIKLRRSLHEDDYKKIFDEPGVGGM